MSLNDSLRSYLDDETRPNPVATVVVPILGGITELSVEAQVSSFDGDRYLLTCDFGPLHVEFTISWSDMSDHILGLPIDNGSTVTVHLVGRPDRRG